MGQWVWTRRAFGGSKAAKRWREGAISRAGGRARYDTAGNIVTQDMSDDDDDADDDGDDGGGVTIALAGPAFGGGSSTSDYRTPMKRTRDRYRRGSDAGSVSSIATDRTDISSVFGPSELGYAPSAALASAMDWASRT